MGTILTEQMLAQHLAIVGKSGSGKTYTSKGAVENLITAKRRVCILDPTGVWFGLRSSADGKKAGFAVVVFGGPHADVQISETSGEALARVLAEKNVPAIIDLSEMLIGQRHRFATDFAEALYRLNRAPLHLVIDEADEFMPQNPLPETKRMLHHFDRIVRRGRVRGFRVMLITQRPAVLHKNVLTQANTLIAMRLTAPQDRAAIKAWIEGQGDAAQGKAVLDSLPRLQRGQGWIWCPEEDVLEKATFPRITTFDSSRTPENDEVLIEPTKLAAVDLTEIEASFAAVQTEAVTLRALQDQVKHLKAEIASYGHDVGVSEAQAAVHVDRAVTALRSAYSARLGKFLGAMSDILSSAQAITKQFETQEIMFAGEATPAPAPLTVRAEPAPRRAAPAETHARPAPKPSGNAGQRVMDAIAWWNSAGVATPSRHQVAFVARYTVNGHFNNTCGALKASALIEYPGNGTLVLTDTGRSQASAPPRRPSGQELIERVMSVLKGEPQQRVFMVLVRATRSTMTREELAAGASYTVNGHFNNILGALNGIGVIEYPKKGYVSLARDIFGSLE